MTTRTQVRIRRAAVVLLALALLVALALLGRTLLTTSTEASEPTTPTAADGILPDGASPFEDSYPGIGNLDPALLAALQEAATDAAARDVGMWVTSGWRSPLYQEQLLTEAVAEYGSREEAARWVATPETSSHVSGDAVDIGPYDAMSWMQAHGDAYGLCQTYGNEPWHFELVPEAPEQGCPAVYADPTQDPRMQE